MSLKCTSSLRDWNAGIMEQWGLGKWDMVLLEKYLLTCESEKQKYKKFPLQANIQPFHYSMYEVEAYTLKETIFYQ